MANSLWQTIERAYRMLIAAGSWLQSPILLALRLDYGWQFFSGGKPKLLHPEPFIAKFAEWGIPLPSVNVALAGATETVGGLLLMAGLASRLISLPLAFTMVVAFATAERANLLSLFSDPDAFAGATPLPFLLTVLTVLAFGPGVFSLDWLIARKLGRRDGLK